MSDKSKLRLLGQSSILFDDLRMKQSVRTTFKLPEDVINLLGIIAGQLGIKQKSLLDQLTEDAGLLSKLAKEANPTIGGKEKRQAKTFVISRSSLNSINNGAISEVNYELQGCLNTNACCNALATLAEGKLVEKSWEINPKDIIDILETLPVDHHHCAELTVGTFYLALAEWSAGKSKK